MGSWVFSATCISRELWARLVVAKIVKQCCRVFFGMGLVFTDAGPRNCSTASGGQGRSAAAVARLARLPLRLARVHLSWYRKAQAFLSSSCFQFAVLLWNEVFLHYQEGQKGGGRIGEDEPRTLNRSAPPFHQAPAGLEPSCWARLERAAAACHPLLCSVLPASPWPRVTVKKGGEPKEARDQEVGVWGWGEIPMARQLWIHVTEAATFSKADEPE